MSSDDDIAHPVIPESSARDSEARYRSMFEQSPLPMWMYDRSTLRFVAVNEAAIQHYGYSRDEFATMTIADIRPPEDLDALRAHVGDAQGFDLAPTTWRHQKKDGLLISVEIKASDFVLDGQDVRLVLINDVTARERAQEALRKAEQQLRQIQKMDAIGRLAGGVAHDTNNVLTVILTYAGLLEDDPDASEARREDAAEIRRAAERGAAITRQLLALSRHSSAEVSSLDVNELIATIAPMLRRLVGERILLVVHHVDTPPVLADRGQLEQVLLNLAVNARDAMLDGGRLTIETTVVDLDGESAAAHGLQRPGRYVAFAVTDTGTGIDAESQQKIFEPFFTTKPLGKGTGLGLSIVHGIVAQAGGAISVYSEVGHGTTFRVYLPVTHESVAASSHPIVDAPRTLPPMTVLVVDDDREVRHSALRVLQEAGCTVLDAASGQEALRICVSHDGPIDVVVLDVVLADARGDLLVEELSRVRPSIKALLMSGYPAGALSAGGGTPPDLLAKPFSPSELRSAVGRAAGTSGETSDVVRHRAAPAPHARVLIADDDDAFRRALVRLLQRGEFDVVDVNSGAKAIQALASSTFDVIVSDIHMPDGSGLDLIRAVRRIDLDVPVILVTGQPDIATAAAAVEYGAFRFLTKPVQNETFTKTVRHAARAHALARVRREAFSVTGGESVGARDRAGLEVRFESALERVWMAFQPIVDAKTGALHAVEALMRSDEGSMATPLALLDAATQLARIHQLGRRIRSVSAHGVASWDDSVALFVNLHPDDLLDTDLIDEDSPLTRIARRVVLEITERAALTSSPKLTERIARLRALGFRLAVDDIGAGYSGLTSFTELEPELVKIDMSLVRDVHQSALKQRTIAALCRLCHESGAVVVGEGVETLAERECLVSLGCDLLQGYLVGRPTRPG